ncbi:MAG: fructosamine kinase family protein, partial [Candidatus Sericytochromatia bacterium]
MRLPAELRNALETALGANILHSQPLGGGCIHEALRLETSEGPLFCKWNKRGQEANFAADAAGLQRLAASATLRVPGVRAQVRSPQHTALVLEYLEAGPESPEFWEKLAQGLAALHQHSAPAFGLEADNFIGSLPQANGWMDDFHRFWAERRLQPLLEQAWPRLTAEDRPRAQRLLEKLPELIPAEAPALL